MRRFFLFFLALFFSLQFSALAEPTILKIQKKLKTLGFYHGTIDGILGSQTNAAIRRYQVQHRLTITGELNKETLQSLKIASSKEK